MKLIWFGLLFETLMLALIKQFIVDFEFVAIMAVSIHVLFTTIILMSYKDKIKMIFLGAYFSRVAFLVWDLYFRHIYVLPNSGADSEGFYRTALYYSNDLLILISKNIGLYPKLNGFLFHFIGPQRMFAQYINVLLGLSIIFIIYKILTVLEVSEKARTTIILIAAFFPNSMVMSAIFLREITPTFFVSVSLYYFMRWFKTPRYKSMILSFLMLGIASMFHSGVIGIIIGYIYVFLFYKRDRQSFKFTARTVVSFIVIGIIAFGGFTLFGDKILYKFGKVEEIEDIFSTANSRLGGSAYLKGMTINNPIQLVLFGPIKSLFFLTAPLPINWRGFMDIFTFFTDSMLYLITIIYYLKNRKQFGDRHSIVLGIVVMIIGASIIFGIGVSNAGTAVRHRQKLIPLFLVLLGVMTDGKKSFKRKHS